MDGVLNGLEPLQPRVVMQWADAQSKCLKGPGLCALFFARRPARCYSVAMQPLMCRVMGVAWWMSVGLILSACAVLTNPTVTPATSPQSALPTPIARSTVTLPFSPSPLPSPTTPSAVKPPATQAASPLATPLPFASVAQVLDLSFIDPQRGWFLATSCGGDHICPISIHATDDGGQTWQAVNAPAAEAIFSESNLSDTRHVDALRFTDADVGWSFNPDFFSTRDGGKTWTDERRSVVALELVGQSVWAIEQRGDQSVVVASNDLGRTWTVIGNLPTQYRRLLLVRADVQTAWILPGREMGREPQLFMTRDGGHSWQPESLPTDAGHCTSLNLARSSDKKLWLLCGDGLATAMQPKSLYASIDNEASWNLVANNDPTGESKPKGRIPIVGHILNSRQFVVTSSTTAFMALNRGTLYVTHDGGQNWDAVVTDQPINLGDAAIGPLCFIDRAHGWLVAAGRVFRTADGGVTWQIFPIQ